jgi:PAS domain S-box-containing protein
VTLVGLAGSVTGNLRQRTSRIAGVAAAMIAAAVLVGGWAGLPLLASWGAGLPAMRPPGALCLAALGLALAFPGRDQRFAVVIGTVVAGLAAFLLTAALSNADVGIDWLALRSPGPEGTAFRIVHASTVAFVLTGAALALSPHGRCRLAATVLAGMAAAIALFALLNYLTGIDTLHVAARLASPPLPTAVSLLCVACGILLRIGAMPALRRPRPLWQLLAVLGCAILMPLLLFGAYAEVSIADAQLAAARRSLMHEARAVSAEYDRQIEGEINRLKALAASPSLRQGKFAVFRRQAEASLGAHQDGNIMLVDRDMKELVNTSTTKSSSMEVEKAAIAELEAAALATAKPQFTDLFTGAGQALFAIVVPVEIDDENRYALVRSINRRALTEPIAPDNLPPGWQAAILTASDRVLARTIPLASPLRAGHDTEDEEIGTVLPWAPLRHPFRTGVTEFTDAKGRPSLAGYAVSTLTGWEAAVWEPKALLEAPVRALWRTLGWLALLSLGLVIALASWLGRLIAGSVSDAAGAATAVSEGNVNTAPAATPVAEVNMLMAELRETAARRQAADDLVRDSERQLRLVTDNAPVAIARCDAEGRFTFANKLFMERYGFTYEQIIGKRIADVIGDAAFAAIERYIAECLAGHAVEFAFEARDHAGEPRCIQGRFAPEWRDGKVVGFLGATTDITGLKRAEQRLRASEVTFRQLIDNSPLGIYVVDADFRLVQASIGARRAFADVTPLIGRDLAVVLRSIWPEPFATEAIDRFRHTLATGEPYHAPASIERRKDTGVVESYDWKVERLAMPDGRFGVVCHFYDLSERQKYEAALRESEETFRAMFDSSAVGKIEIDAQTGRLLRANAAMCRFVGYSEEELRARTVFDITHPDEREQDRDSLCSMAGGMLPVFDREKRYVRKDGKIVWARVTANVIRNAAGRPMRNTAVIQDINDRKQAEQDLEASRTRLQLALDTARLGWFQYDLARRSAVGDARFNEIFDIATDDTPLDELLTHVYPGDVEKVRAGFAVALSSDEPKPSVVEYRALRRDGEVRWVEIHGLAFLEGVGRERRAVSLIGTVQDITERKQREEQMQLLIREVSHRAKNMLSVVHAIAHQTATRNPEDFIARLSERIQALSANQDLLVRNEWMGVGIAELVRAQLEYFSDLIGSRIVVHGPALRLKAASAQAIGLALHELATNAGKYGALSNEAGRVTVRWRTRRDVFHMSWTERGGPPVSAPTQRGFGTIVMDVMAERTVDGKVDLDYAPAGVMWRLTCRAANVLERWNASRQAGSGIRA